MDTSDVEYVEIRKKSRLKTVAIAFIVLISMAGQYFYMRDKIRREQWGVVKMERIHSYDMLLDQYRLRMEAFKHKDHIMDVLRENLKNRQYKHVAKQIKDRRAEIKGILKTFDGYVADARAKRKELTIGTYLEDSVE